jgi:YVTN family beta-propeller protein
MRVAIEAPLRPEAVIAAFALVLLGGCINPIRESCAAEPALARSGTGATAPSNRSSTVVWVAADVGGRVIKVDIRNRRVLSSFNVRGNPHNVTVAPDGTVIATLQRTGRVAMIRDGHVRHVHLGGSPHDVKAGRRVAVVANEGARRLDLVSLTGRRMGSIPLKAHPHDVALAPEGGVAWATLNWTDDIAVVSLERKRVVRYLSTGVRPHNIVVTPDGRRVWVTDWEDGVHVFSREGRLIKTIPQGTELQHVAFSPDGREAWITAHGNDSVLIFSVEARRLIGTRRIEGEPHDVAITAAGECAIVADHDQGTIVLFDVETRRQVATIPVGAGPHGVWAES